MSSPNPPRIVSLLASATEIICALGLRNCLVARSHECDYPADVRELPACTAPNFRTTTPSAQIDADVKGLLEQALSIYRVDADLLHRLQPTHIITQTQCEVCAVSLKDVEDALKSYTGSEPEIVALQPNALEDVWADMLRVAEVLQVLARGEKLVSGLQKRMAVIEEQSQSVRRRRTVACVEWIDPLMASGNWMPELVRMAGGHNLFGESGAHAPNLEWLEVVAANPDVILILPCGFNLQRTREEAPLLTRKMGWNSLRAVENGRVFLLDGNQYFNRPGPRLLESLEILAEVIHPEAFHFGHEGTGWQRLPSS